MGSVALLARQIFIMGLYIHTCRITDRTGASHASTLLSRMQAFYTQTLR